MALAALTPRAAGVRAQSRHRRQQPRSGFTSAASPVAICLPTDHLCFHSRFSMSLQPTAHADERLPRDAEPGTALTPCAVIAQLLIAQ